MNELFRSLAGQLKGAGAGSKAVAALVGVALIAAIGITAVVANRPHMEMLRTGLQDYELSAVCGALGTAGIEFETSQPPGPFTVFVDQNDRYRAFAEIYKAGALDKPMPGIEGGGGMEDIFSSAGERTLKTWKKRWEEVELMLLSLDFIYGASISTALPSGSTIGRLKGETITASVTLQTRGRTLNEEQRSSVARVVGGAFGIKREDIVVVDERGQLLFDGTADDEKELGGSLRDLVEHEERWERTKTEEVNARLTAILGPNKALVSIDSVWDIDQSVTRSDVTSKGELLSETKSETTTPIPDNSAGGVAGFDANMPNATGAGAIPGATPAEPPEPILAETSDSEKRFAPSTATTQQVTNKYRLARLSIALWVDESVANPDSIRDYVASALGYDEARDPEFVAQVGPINVPEPVETEESPEEPESGIMVLVEKYMQRGVEILVALVFIILLLKSLKGAKTSSKARAVARTQAAAADAEVDPELLARVQVEELLKADPERVGEILSAWVRDEAGTAKVKS